MSAPRIAYLVTEDWAFVRHRLPMARAARAAGFDVHVLTRVSDHRAAIEREGFILHPLKWRRSSLSPFELWRSIAEVRAILSTVAPAIVHNVAVKPTLVGSIACLGLPGVGIINSIVGLGSVFLARSPSGKALKVIVSRLLRLLLTRPATVTIVQNPDDHAALLAMGVAENKIVLIPGSGVDTVQFRQSPEPEGHPVKAAFVGRMLDDKGVRTIVEAHRLVTGRGGGLELLLVGEPDPENPTSIGRDELEAWAREPGIRYLGHVDDIAGLWSSVNFAVLPSRREGFPKSLLEAAASGRAMVASDVPGCREIVKDGVTGRLATVDDPQSFAAAMTWMIERPAERARMGREARLMVEQKFSAHEIGRQTAALYRTLLAGAAA